MIHIQKQNHKAAILILKTTTDIDILMTVEWKGVGWVGMGWNRTEQNRAV